MTTIHSAFSPVQQVRSERTPRTQPGSNREAADTDGSCEGHSLQWPEHAWNQDYLA